MIAAVVGPRTLDTAKEVVAVTKARVAGIPAFFSDGFTSYLAALIAAFHVVTTFVRTGTRGRPRKPSGATSGAGLRAVGQTEETGQAVDAQHPRLAWGRTPDPTGPHDQHGLGRTGEPDLAAGLGAIGTQDVQLLQRPRAHAAAGSLLPGLLQCCQTAHDLAAAVADTRAQTPRRASSPMAGERRQWRGA